MSLIEHIKEVSPIIDINNKFIYFSINKNAQKSILSCINRKNVVFEKTDPTGFCNKITELSDLSLDTIFMFVIVRNPWDKVVSAFHYLQQNEKKIISTKESFDPWICNVFKHTGISFDPHFETQHQNCFYKGKQFVNFIGRLETIDNDWLYIANKIGVNITLPKIGPSQRGKNYRSYYTAKSRDIVASIYTKDISFLQYTY